MTFLGTVFKIIIFFAVVTSLSFNIQVKASGSLSRIEGQDRIKTAIAISKRLFAKNDMAGGIVLAQSNDFPDALAAASLAGALNAPILLNRPNANLDSEVKKEIDRVLPDDGNIYLVGGVSALSSSIDQALKNNYKMHRLAGRNRYATAALIKKKVDQIRGTPLPTAIFARGDNFADAVSASSYAAFSATPILLVKPNQLPPETQAVLTPDIDAAFILGGTAAINPNVVTEIENTIGNLSTRIQGQDRYETSAKISDFFFANPPGVSFATGENFPDALAGGVLSGKSSLSVSGLPIILTRSESVPSSIIYYLKKHAKYIDDDLSGYLFGGSSAITIQTEFDLERYL